MKNFIKSGKALIAGVVLLAATVAPASVYFAPQYAAFVEPATEILRGINEILTDNETTN